MSPNELKTKGVISGQVGAGAASGDFIYS
jgi:hypothetical protein